LRTAEALFPGLNRFGADAEEAGEHWLAGIQTFADVTNFGGLHGLGRRWNFGYAQVNSLAAFKGEGFAERFAHIVVDIHFSFLWHFVLLESF
jgi:hypothetical protein